MKKLMIITMVLVLFIAGCSSVPEETSSTAQPEDENSMTDKSTDEYLEETMGKDSADQVEEHMGEMADEMAMEMRVEENLQQIEESSLEACDDWKCQDLVDAVSGEIFQIKDFEGQVVLIESFAVWCPTCLKQQREMAKVDGVVHVALDTDPNEDVSIVKEHAEKNGFDWRFVVSPIEVTKALIAEFGAGVVSAPRAPVVMVCADQSTRFLPGGLKKAAELKAEIAKGC